MDFQRSSGTNSRYSKDSFDRFGDDLCGFLLKFLDPNDKFLLECVSKQWKKNLYSQCTELKLGWGGLNIRQFHRNFIKRIHIQLKCRSAYVFVRKIEVLSDFEVYDDWLPYLPFLEEIVIHKIPAFDIDDINGMIISDNIKKVFFKKVIEIEYFDQFEDIESDIAHCVKELNIRFFYGTQVCINRLSALKNLEYLRIYNGLDISILTVFSKTLSKLKELEIDSLHSMNFQSISSICESFKSLRSFLCKFNGSEYSFEWLRQKKSTFIAKEIKSIGSKQIFSSYTNDKSVFLSPSDGLCCLDSIFEINWLSHKEFAIYKSFIFYKTPWFYREDWVYFSRMLKYGAASKIIMDENHINQNFIELFKEKASKQPKEIFFISIIGTAKTYRILDNFHIYLNKAKIENGLINHDRKK